MFEREFYQNKEFHTNNGLVCRTAKSARLIAIFSMQDSTYNLQLLAGMQVQTWSTF